MPKIARPWSAVVTTRRAARGLDLAIGELEQLFQVDLAVAIPVDDLRQTGKGRLRGIDRGLFLAFEVAVLVGVGGLELLLEDAAGLLGRGVAVFDVDVEPDLSDGELDVAVGELPDLRSLRQGPAGFHPDRRPAGSLGREGDVERQVDRRPGEELSQLVRVQRVVAVRIGAGEGVRVDRELGGRQLVVGPSRYVALSLVIFLEQEPGRPKRRLTGDQLDDRREAR